MNQKKALCAPGNLPLSAIEDEEEADYWQNHVDQWIQSGLSQSAYCRKHKLSYNQFRKWKEHLSTYPSSSTSLKLVEVRRDFTLKPHNGDTAFASSFVSVSSPSGGINFPGDIRPGIGHGGSSGIRFWCGEFCIEVDVNFSSTTLKQLVRTLESVYMNRGIEPDTEGDAEVDNGQRITDE